MINTNKNAIGKMNSEILEFIEENDVKFIKLSFCDPFGNMKNMSILSTELASAFSEGRPVNTYALPVFSQISDSDLLLFPDASTLSLLPWRPQTNSVLRFYCDIKNPDTTTFSGDGRAMLKNTVKKLKNMGFSCKMGTRCEFYLFKTDEFDEPTMTTHDKGGYLDVAPLDKGENIRREICLCLEQIGLNPENSHHEQGPGQNEIDFNFSDPLSAADNFLTFKSVVKSIASRNGLFASFAPKPFLDKSGSGMHLNISLQKDGKNIFSDHETEDFKFAKMFIAGILEKIAEITLFINSNVNSYERFGSYDAPKYISWSHQNHSELLRIPIATKGNERMELRSPDPALNPYIAFSLILQAGMYGIENELTLCEDYDKNNLLLPKDLGEAINLAKNSDFVKKFFDESFLKKYIEIKQNEFENYQKSIDRNAYFKDNLLKIL